MYNFAREHSQGRLSKKKNVKNIEIKYVIFTPNITSLKQQQKKKQPENVDPSNEWDACRIGASLERAFTNESIEGLWNIRAKSS